MSENTSIALVSTENAHDVIKEIQEAFYDIPFENSQFQTENFVIAAAITPERAYRAIGLKLTSKLRIVEEYIINTKMLHIEIEEYHHKINSDLYNDCEKRRFQLEIEKIKLGIRYSEKLLNDSIVEINILYKHFKALPKYTRQQFEEGEKRHYLERLNRQVSGVDGARESLINMFDDVACMNNFEEEFKKISGNYDSEKLLELNENILKNTISPSKNEKLNLRSLINKE